MCGRLVAGTCVGDGSSRRRRPYGKWTAWKLAHPFYKLAARDCRYLGETASGGSCIDAAGNKNPELKDIPWMEKACEDADGNVNPFDPNAPQP